MSDEQKSTDTQDEPTESTPKARRPGFFSRLFTSKGIETPLEEHQTPTQEEPSSEPAPPEEIPEQPSGPEGFDLQPALEEAETDPGKKRGVFSRWFRRKEAPPESPDQEAGEEQPPAEIEPEPPKKSWFERLRERLRRGSGSFIASIRDALGMSGKLDEETLEQLEDILIAADVGMETTMKITKRLQERAREEKAEGAERIMEVFKEVVTEVFTGNVKPFEPKNPEGPYVVLVTGVNGVGKTTTIGKMAKRCRDAGLKTMLVAGDTFRAAAIEQLEIWAQRTESDFLKSKHGADPSGLVFDALKTAKSRNIDVVFVDTAGRLQTKSSLMEELGKIHRVCDRVQPGSPHETLLVLDATTGQNAVSQVQAFQKIIPLSGLVMTKLDGTAKGGILLSLRDQFNIPITLIGVGEGIDDLRDFDPEQFAAALFEEGGTKAK
ncbi:MAG: signal recognition particle-docking protein FtsY [Candidatus Sumerlaeia bacterium]|nr:signal recognition particle-docking protein FtsY [Candidatus Sumerlaeia bacterium]